MLISWSRPIAECIDCLSLRRGSNRRGNRNSHNNGVLEHHEKRVDDPREKQENHGLSASGTKRGVNDKEGITKQQADEMHAAAEMVTSIIRFFVPHNRGEKVKVERFPFVSRRRVLAFDQRAFITRGLQRDGVLSS